MIDGTLLASGYRRILRGFEVAIGQPWSIGLGGHCGRKGGIVDSMRSLFGRAALIDPRGLCPPYLSFIAAWGRRRGGARGRHQVWLAVSQPGCRPLSLLDGLFPPTLVQNWIAILQEPLPGNCRVLKLPGSRERWYRKAFRNPNPRDPTRTASSSKFLKLWRDGQWNN